MVTITSATLLSSIWENFYDRLNGDTSAKTVTLKDATTSTVQNITASFPEKILNTKSSFPVWIINSADIKWDNFTFTKDKVAGTITIDCYTTKSESADKFIDAINNSLETYKVTFRSVGIYDLKLDGMSYADGDRGAFKIHIKSCTWRFNYIFNKTIAY